MIGVNGKTPTIGLIALDLDGTLMMPDHISVSAANKAALRAAHESGAKIAVATGRTLSILGNVCEQVPQIDYILYSNGAGVFDRKNNAVLFEQALPQSTGLQLLEYFDTLPAFLEVYAGGKSYAQQDKEPFFPADAFPKVFVEAARRGMIICDDLKETLRETAIEKFTVYITDRKIYRQAWDELSARADLSVTTSFPISIDVTFAGADKGTALQKLCARLGVLPEHCMAFGDAANDLPMLTFARYGFAMENASEVCKAGAPYQTKSNAEDGVALAVQQVMRLQI